MFDKDLPAGFRVVGRVLVPRLGELAVVASLNRRDTSSSSSGMTSWLSGLTPRAGGCGTFERSGSIGSTLTTEGGGFVGGRGRGAGFGAANFLRAALMAPMCLVLAFPN